MTIPRKDTLLCAILTIVLAALLIQGAAFAGGLTFGREKLKGPSKTQGDFNLTGEQNVEEVRNLSCGALHKVNDALKGPSPVEKTPRETTNRVNNPPMDLRVIHLQKAKGLLEKVGTYLTFDNNTPLGRPITQDAQVLTAQAIVKMNDLIREMKAVGDDTSGHEMIKNLLEQANQELKLAKTKPNSSTDIGK